MFKGIKTAIAVALSIGGLGTAVTLSAVAASPREEVAYAENSDWGYVGNGQGNNWTPSNRIRLTATGQPEDYFHCFKTFTFVQNEEFKFIDKDNWGSDIGYSNLNFGNALNNFEASGTNIKCKTAGSYDVGIVWNGSKNCIGIFNSGTFGDDPNSTRYIYVTEKPDDNGYWKPTKIYAFNVTEQYGGFNDTTFSSLTDYYGTATVNLNGERGNIYRIPYRLTDMNFILHNGGGYQTVDSTFYENNCYYYNGKDGSGKVQLANNADLGAAAAFISRVEELRDHVTADPQHQIAVYSICGISQSDINALATQYNSLNATAKGYVNNSTVTTYTGSYGSEEGTVSYSDIASQLAKMANGGQSSNLINNISNNNSAVAIIIVTSTIVLTSGLAFFLLRKKRKEY